jgi:hypothetical protein
MHSVEELKAAAEKGFVNVVGVEDAAFEKAVAQFHKSPNSTYHTGRKDGRDHVWRAGNEESNFFPITEADGKVKILVPLSLTRDMGTKPTNRFTHVEAGLRDQGFQFKEWIYDAEDKRKPVGKVFEKDGKIEKLFFDDRETSLDKAARVCHLRGCEVNTRLLTCSGCKMVKYCGAEHQAQDWAHHKQTCKLLARGDDKTTEFSSCARVPQ